LLCIAVGHTGARSQNFSPDSAAAASDVAMITTDTTGIRMAVPGTARYEMVWEKSRKGESLWDTAHRLGYDIDANTLAAIIRWNSDISRPPTAPLADDGEWLNFVRPKYLPQNVKLSVNASGAFFLPLIFHSTQLDLEEAEVALGNARDTRSLSRETYETLRSAADDLERANAIFVAQSVAMTPRQCALAAFQMEAATAQVRTAATGRSRDPGVSSKALAAGVEMADEAEQFARNLEPPTPPRLKPTPRKFKVSVQSNLPGRTPEALTVYVLPKGLFTYGPAVEERKLFNLLGVLALPKLTTPAMGDLEPGITYAVWIGPRNSAKLMANLVKSGTIDRFKTIDASAERLEEVTFEESDKVVAQP
jgi:hypothetical protein